MLNLMYFQEEMAHLFFIQKKTVRSKIYASISDREYYTSNLMSPFEKIWNMWSVQVKGIYSIHPRRIGRIEGRKYSYLQL